MKYFIAIFITAVAVFLGATIYYKGLPVFPKYSKSPVSTEIAVPSATPIPTPVDETEILKTIIKNAIIAKRGGSASQLTISVSKIEGDYAVGGAGGEGGGGMWLAAKENGNWVLVWDGNGQINCSDISPFPGFPTDIVPECWDETTSKLVKR